MDSGINNDGRNETGAARPEEPTQPTTAKDLENQQVHAPPSRDARQGPAADLQHSADDQRTLDQGCAIPNSTSATPQPTGKRVIVCNPTGKHDIVNDPTGSCDRHGHPTGSHGPRVAPTGALRAAVRNRLHRLWPRPDLEP